MKLLLYGIALVIAVLIGYSYAFVEERLSALNYRFYSEVPNDYKVLPERFVEVTECVLNDYSPLGYKADRRIAQVLSSSVISHRSGAWNYALSDYFTSRFIAPHWKSRQQRVVLYLFTIPYYDRSNEGHVRQVIYGVDKASKVFYQKNLLQLSNRELGSLLYSQKSGKPSLKDNPERFYDSLDFKSGEPCF